MLLPPVPTATAAAAAAAGAVAYRGRGLDFLEPRDMTGAENLFVALSLVQLFGREELVGTL